MNKIHDLIPQLNARLIASLTSYFISCFKAWGQELNTFDWAAVQDIDTVGSWPNSVKATLCAAAFVLCMFLGHYFYLQEPRQEVRNQELSARSLKQELQHKSAMAAGLEASRSEAATMATAFASLLQYLPSADEIPSLIDDITAAGEGSGLEITHIQPSAEIPREFYAELPIQINAVGGYHDFASFVSSVAALDHIVTLQDFVISEGGHGRLDLSVTAHSYRYGAGAETGTGTRAEAEAEAEAEGLSLPPPLSQLPPPPVAAFTYAAAARPSPFAEPAVVASRGSKLHSAARVSPDFSRHRSHLEGADINDLSLVGWLQRGGVYEALIEDRTGAVHRLRAGDYLGRNHGRVTAITAGQVSVLEIVPAGSGWIERPQTLTQTPSAQTTATQAIATQKRPEQ